MIVRVVVGGEEEKVEVEANDALSLVRWRALVLSRNLGRPETDWEMRDDLGRMVELSASPRLERYYFLSLRVGAGG